MYYALNVYVYNGTYSLREHAGYGYRGWPRDPEPLTSLDLSGGGIFEPLIFDTDIRDLGIMGRSLRWWESDPATHDLSQKITKDLCDMVRHNTTLTSLALTRVNISAVKSFVESVGHNTKVTSLTLSEMFAGESVRPSDEVDSIFRALSLNTTLRSLDLRWCLDSRRCNLTSHAPSIAAFITINSTLTSLDLSRNNLIMDPTLVHALCYNTTLTSINLFEHEEGICPKELSTVLRCNTTLTSCRVEWPLDLYSLGLIAAGLKHNASLTHLDNGVGAKRWQKGEMKIESYLQRNKDNQIKRSWTLYEILLVRLRR